MKICRHCSQTNWGCFNSISPTTYALMHICDSACVRMCRPAAVDETGD